MFWWQLTSSRMWCCGSVVPDVKVSKTDCFTLQMKALQTFETSRTSRETTGRRTLEECSKGTSYIFLTREEETFTVLPFGGTSWRSYGKVLWKHQLAQLQQSLVEPAVGAVTEKSCGSTIWRSYGTLLWSHQLAQLRQNLVRGCADKSLARPGRKHVTVSKVGIYSTNSPRSSVNFLSRCSNFCKPLKKNQNIVLWTRPPL